MPWGSCWAASGPQGRGAPHRAAASSRDRCLWGCALAVGQPGGSGLGQEPDQQTSPGGTIRAPAPAAWCRWLWGAPSRVVLQSWAGGGRAAGEGQLLHCAPCRHTQPSSSSRERRDRGFPGSKCLDDKSFACTSSPSPYEYLNHGRYN